jgi:cathepsin X
MWFVCVCVCVCVCLCCAHTRVHTSSFKAHEVRMKTALWLAILYSVIAAAFACRCEVDYEATYGIPVKTVVKSPQPHQYLRATDLPETFDWRNVNGTNYGSRVLNQQSPNVCGSCWAEAVTGAFSDRYNIATGGKLNIQLSVQQFLNFNSQTTGGSCNGGDSLKGYEFIYTYGVVDDSCGPFVGLNWLHGFSVAGMTDVEDVQNHQCYMCDWDGTCGFKKSSEVNIYGADEYGTVLGESEMKAEIYARGPIACSLNSEPNAFDKYHGGIISCDPEVDGKACNLKGTDHVVVIAGWGVDKVTGKNYWVGRNSYGTQWGEGAGGGWFRLERGKNYLNMETHSCKWAVPAAAHVQRALDQYKSSTPI